MEQQLLLDPQSNPLFTPVPVMEGVTPLEDCVLSFSQFTGAERDSLVYLAELLGARYVSCHDFFLFLANVIKSIMYLMSCFTGVTVIRSESLGFYSFTKPSAEAMRSYYIVLFNFFHFREI